MQSTRFCDAGLLEAECDPVSDVNLRWSFFTLYALYDRAVL